MPPPEPDAKYVSLESLGSSVENYNSLRDPKVMGRLATLCYAPFTGMSFTPKGDIGCCNCSTAWFGNVQDGRTLQEVWRSAAIREMRANMMEFKIDPKACMRCALDIGATAGFRPYSIAGFDELAVDSAEPDGPVSLHFNLSTKCNLKCIMCWEEVSSRIMIERMGRPVAPSPYGEPFFAQLRELLPNVKKITFTGGEPFMVEAHLRILDLMREVGSKAKIHVSTNGLAFSNRVKALIEALDFEMISVSMDGWSKAVHDHVRVGMNHDRFLKNLQWLFESRERLGLYVILNFNELRQNWFEIPMIFRFAAQNSCRVHTNHCVGPEFCTIYDLPRRELLYVQEFLVRQREELKQELVAHENHLPYDHLLVNIAARLDAGAEPTWSPEFRAYLENRERGASDAAGDPEEFGAFLTEKVMTDGLLTAPIPGQEPFETPAKVAAEITRIVELGGPVAVRLLTAIEKTVAILGSEWAPVGVEIAGARRRVAASIDRPASHTSAAAGG